MQDKCRFYFETSPYLKYINFYGMIPLTGYPSCVFQTYLWLLLCWYWWLESLTFWGNFTSPIFGRNLNHGCAEFQFSTIFSITGLLQFNITESKLVFQRWIKPREFPDICWTILFTFFQIIKLFSENMKLHSQECIFGTEVDVPLLLVMQPVNN